MAESTEPGSHAPAGRETATAVPIPFPRSSGEGAPMGGRAAGDGAHPFDDGPFLTDRDRELLRHLAEGRSTARIAAAMSVTGNTARTRIRRLQGKLDAPDRRRVVVAARDLGVI